MKSSEYQYEVLNPWAEVDQISIRGISPRLEDLANKTVGTFASTYKVASRPILDAVETRLKQKYPGIKFSQYNHGFNLEVTETDEKARFEEWLKGVDAVISAVGD